jgi:hypothetical protein
MQKVKTPRAGGQPPAGEKQGSASKSNLEEIDLQALEERLAHGESVQLTDGVWFIKPFEVVFAPIPAPEGWLAEFGVAALHPRSDDILFHRAFFAGPGPWPPDNTREERITLSDAWQAYPAFRGDIRRFAFLAWRKSGARPLAEQMTEEVRALWESYQKDSGEIPRV